MEIDNAISRAWKVLEKGGFLKWLGTVFDFSLGKF